MKRAVCIWLPKWPIQRLVGVRPELKWRPVVLYAPGRGGGQRVVVCSGAAGKLGVRAGMPLAEADALAGHSRRPPHPGTGDDAGQCGLYCQAYDPEADRETLVELATWCQQFSPVVGLEMAARPESLLLDITGLATLFDGEEALGHRLVEAFQQRDYAVRAATADTVGAAWAVAHFGGRQPEGTEDGKSCKMLMVAPGKSFDALYILPIRALRLPEQVVEVLERLGIERIGQLAQLPRESLLSRFGPQLLVRLDQATGAKDEQIVAHHPRVQPEADWALEWATDRHDVIDRVVGVLVERVAAKLVARGRGALQLVCRFDCQSGRSVTLTTGLFQPSASAEHLLALVRTQLAQVRIGSPVCRVSVTVTASAALVDRQKTLFDGGHSPQDARQFAALVDRLTGRLGRQAVVRVWLVPDAQPERAFREEPLVAGSEREYRSAATDNLSARVKDTGGRATRGTRQNRLDRPLASEEGQDGVSRCLLKPTARGRREEGADYWVPLERPLHLFSRPQPIEVVAVVPDGPPGRLLLAGRQHHVARHWGPERIETAWWWQEPARRDYYCVETTRGYRFWLFRRLQDGKWFWHGVF